MSSLKSNIESAIDVIQASDLPDSEHRRIIGLLRKLDVENEQNQQLNHAIALLLEKVGTQIIPVSIRGVVDARIRGGEIPLVVIEAVKEEENGEGHPDTEQNNDPGSCRVCLRLDWYRAGEKPDAVRSAGSNKGGRMEAADTKAARSQGEAS